MFTIRKLSGLTALALVLGMASWALAADVKYTAKLIAQRGDPLATGRAMWESQGRIETFSVVVDNVASTDFATVVVDGQLVGTFDIIEGFGSLIVSNVQEAVVPAVHPGSKIVIYAGDTDRPILYGVFQRQ